MWRSKVKAEDAETNETTIYYHRKGFHEAPICRTESDSRSWKTKDKVRKDLMPAINKIRYPTSKVTRSPFIRGRLNGLRIILPLRKQ